MLSNEQLLCGSFLMIWFKRIEKIKRTEWFQMCLKLQYKIQQQSAVISIKKQRHFEIILTPNTVSTLISNTNVIFEYVYSPMAQTSIS